jgi:hypothetical protein
MTTNECRCGRPTRDAAHVCDQCADTLTRTLGEIPWLEEQLEVTITGTSGIDYRTLGGTPSATPPSPVHWGAAEARANLRHSLVTWVQMCHEAGVRNSSPTPGLPKDTLADISRWLLWRVDGLTLLDIGPDAVDEITNAAAYCHRLIDRRPERQYLGRCDLCQAGSVYATPGGRWARCEACDTAVDADTIKTKLLAELDDRLCTAAEIAHLSTYLGLKSGREQVRNRINQWHTRGLITNESMLDGDPAFRFGAVYERLVVGDYGQKVGA